MKNKTPKTYRQGDVLLIETTETARGKDAREKGRIILAHGEMTGHAHEIEANPEVAFEEVNAARILRVMGRKPAILRHQEHSPIKIKPGTYVTRRQSEYAPEEIRNVAD
jgi:hypothetical protein